MKQRLFITSTGTDVGKTFITAALVRQAKGLGRSVMAYKPLVSGFDPAHVEASDTGVLLRSLGLPSFESSIEHVSRWRFVAALAPNMAAHVERRELDFDEVITHSRVLRDGSEDIVLIEGVGGVMAPITDYHTVLDWIETLEMETVLVTGSYVGTISHTLTALSVLQQRNIPVRSLVVSETSPSRLSLEATVRELRHWTDVPLIAVARRDEGNWTDVSELRGLLS